MRADQRTRGQIAEHRAGLEPSHQRYHGDRRKQDDQRILESARF